jgi:Tfp pilus assembly pilus retraction ATPase PilT
MKYAVYLQSRIIVTEILIAHSKVCDWVRREKNESSYNVLQYAVFDGTRKTLGKVNASYGRVMFPELI